MRRAANENPLVQAALVGGLVLLFGIILYTRVLGSGSSSTSSTDTPTTADATAVPTTAGATAVPGAPSATEDPAAAGAAPAAPVAPPPGAAPEGTVPQSALEPGKGLPAPVVRAYDDGKAVVLLIVKESGIDDRFVKTSVKALRVRHDLAVFVTGAKNVADYSRIINGLGVSQVPALVVIQPKRISGDVPKASVSYGFRGPDSVLQAVQDALYDGHDVPYYPD